MNVSEIDIMTALKNFITTNILDASVQINEDTVLAQAGVDSFSTVEIILFIEREYHVSFPDDKLLPENFKSIRALAALVKELHVA